MYTVVESPAAELLTREAAAEYIRISPRTLAFWASTGKHRHELPSARIGKKSYYRRADMDRWLESRFSPSAK